MLLVIVLVLHIVLVLFSLYKVNKVNFSLTRSLVVVGFLLPILGVLIWYWIFQERQRPEPSHFDEIVPWLSEDQPLEALESAITDFDVKGIVPFREALLLNTSSVRRELLIDLIFESAERFVPLLQTARLNDDVEVVHYATTILSELTAKYDTKLRQLTEQVRKAPTVANQLAYTRFLDLYIKSHIAEGHYAQQLRHQYISRVKTLLQEGLVREKGLFVTLGNYLIEAGDFESLSSLLLDMDKQFPFAEETCLLHLQKLYLEKNQEELSLYLETVRQKRVYFSAENRDFVTRLLSSQGEKIYV
ncbi:hypothetical protein [Streptococcus saliviloxodontae]|uniref:Uncharacterized protein n=1 Tax=Streptococcus saliviloxodontae TaxID=1349416 RepID=A0ABS2PKH4_9STRE|nr:hypothetical protein [Streptococcus saliviloxodontae]MBM7635772.1 hypothetical protein [Streptococcus saliviloxodontae]